jgi:Phosphatidylinositol 3- and 4-kinase
VLHSEVVADISPSRLGARQVHKIAILDMRLLNGDRNDANILVRRAAAAPHHHHHHHDSSGDGGSRRNSGQVGGCATRRCGFIACSVSKGHKQVVVACLPSAL